MALSFQTLETKLNPKEQTYSKSDGNGLYIEVTPKGKKTWRLRYRLAGKHEKVTLGEYPAYGLAEARSWRLDAAALARRGVSPMALKRGDPVPADTKPEVKEMANAFLTNWCGATIIKVQAKQAEAQASNTVEAFAWYWYEQMVEPNNVNPRNIKRMLEKDVIPAIGAKQVAEVSVDDILAITDAIKNRGADQMALATRNALKRMFSFAITRQKTRFNPAAAIEAKHIATASSREVALSKEEIGKVLRAFYQSSMKRSHKLALHLLMLCMVRKSEVIKARWEEIDFENKLWTIPAEREATHDGKRVSGMKTKKTHLVPLSRQALAMFEELKVLASGSEFVFPSRGSLKKHVSDSTLNAAVRALDIDVRDFVIHDFRHTASTLLNENKFNGDWVEKALAHEQGGMRGRYNHAEHLDDRRAMLQWWADFVDDQIEEGRKVIIGRFGKAYQAA